MRPGKGVWNVAWAASIILVILASCSRATEQPAVSNHEVTAEPGLTPTSKMVRVCTERDCGVTLTVNLEGELPASFLFTAATPAGEALSVRCANGEGVYGPQHFDSMTYLECRPDQVLFVNFSPQDVTITVSGMGREVTGSFAPAYRPFYPNGKECPPQCAIGEILFDITGE